jgi:hypothetical protein
MKVKQKKMVDGGALMIKKVTINTKLGNRT